MTHPVKISRALYRSIMDQVGMIELPEDFFIDETLDRCRRALHQAWRVHGRPREGRAVQHVRC